MRVFIMIDSISMNCIYLNNAARACPFSTVTLSGAALFYDYSHTLPNVTATFVITSNVTCALLCANVQTGKTGSTNNNAKSVSHVPVVKQYRQWKPQQLPDLIDKLQQLVSSQFCEADHAIVGRGDFVLTASHAKHRLTINVWSTMSDVR